MTARRSTLASQRAHRTSHTHGRSLWSSRQQGGNLNITVPVHLAYCGVVAALRHFVSRRRSLLAILQVEADAIDCYVEAGGLYLRQIVESGDYPSPLVREIEPPRKGRTPDRTVYRLAAENGKAILFCSSLDHVDEELKLFADLVEILRPPTPRQLIATFRRFGHSLTKSEECLVAAETWTRLIYAFPRERRIATGLRRLREAAERSSIPNTTHRHEGPSLEELSGLGMAKDWGMELALDIAHFKAGLISWDELDTGALISGPPGTGKTIYASALARTCGIPLVVASAAQWQAEGYLNDLLKAMRQSFKEAQKHPIALLFIDEIDAVGSREKGDSHNADYRRQVINGLLELLDGSERRTGVIVVGATNYPGDLDPALLRPGRLERHLEIPRPNAQTRAQIFEYHARLPVPCAHKEHFSRATSGMSGADIRQLVRDAKRVARRAQKSFEFADVTQVMKPLLPLPPEQMRRAAVHETGHAIVGSELGMHLQEIRIVDTFLDGRVNRLGGALFEQPAFAIRTKSFFLDNITMYLAGIAAEVLVYGEFTESVADSPSSDLALATALATRMEACFGMGNSLAIELLEDQDLSQLRARDLSLRNAVSDLLNQQFTRAKNILQRRHIALQQIAAALFNKKSISADMVRRVLSSEGTADEKSGMASETLVKCKSADFAVGPFFPEGTADHDAV